MLLLNRVFYWIAGMVTAEFITQAAHAMLGALCVFMPAALGVHHVWPFSVAFWVYALGKELWFDEVYEGATIRGSGVRDLVFLLGGNLVAWAALLAHNL